jgi:hypothetical protein
MNKYLLLIHIISITLMVSALVLAVVLSNKPGLYLLPACLALCGGFINVGAVWGSALSGILAWISFIEFVLIMVWGTLWSLAISIDKRREAKELKMQKSIQNESEIRQ